ACSDHAGVRPAGAAAIAGAGKSPGRGTARWHPARGRPAPRGAGRPAATAGIGAAGTQARPGAAAARRGPGLCARPGNPAQYAAARPASRLRGAMVRAGDCRARDRAGRHFPQIIPAPMPDIATRERRRRSRRMLLAIFALFFGSMLVAGLLRFSGWRPAGTKSHGELLEPPVDLREARLELVAGGAYAWNPGERLWRLAVAAAPGCAAACRDGARDLAVVWRPPAQCCHE